MCNPQYPVYIISKGRWVRALRLTSIALETMKVPYNIVVEPQEYENYAAVIDAKKIITLPFSNLGLGGIPARNFVWEHAKASDAKRHWILDDNLFCFQRLNRNEKQLVQNGKMFKAAEDFVNRYDNVALSGFNYIMFAPASSPQPPYRLNTRVYSCILIDNALPFRWRGRYNEDTDLSLRVLKAGYCTVLFNAFLVDKTTTMRNKGGNTDALYADNGRELMADSLVEQHPDVAKKVWKFGRWHHSVDYRPFKNNKLIRRSDYAAKIGINNYEMTLVPYKPELYVRLAERT
jgi:hypothetical protein